MLKRFLLSEKNMLTIIILNAIVIFCIYFPSLSKNNVLHILDMIFILVFTLEAIVKIREYGVRNYFQDRWNQFDFALVVLSLPSLLSGIFPIMEINIRLYLQNRFRFITH